jgi:hypothetical protein
MVLVAAGRDVRSNASASAELYDPASGSWTTTGSLNTARYDHTATLLANGMVLVAGSDASAELYDPANGTWTYTGSLNTARSGHTATLLPNGKVLVAGGVGTSGSLASAELYDPANGTWTYTGSLNTARAFHRATLLPNGKVLGAAGLGNDGTLLASAELYTPEETSIAIDIKPGTFPNSINPRGKGVIPVAILTTDTFDATTIDPTTVRFGPNGTEAAPVQSALEDVDGDGDTDMILHFKTQDTGIVCGDTSASLTGETFGGQAIEGSDSIKTVGCK